VIPGPEASTLTSRPTSSPQTTGPRTTTIGKAFTTSEDPRVATNGQLRQSIARPDLKARPPAKVSAPATWCRDLQASALTRTTTVIPGLELIDRSSPRRSPKSHRPRRRPRPASPSPAAQGLGIAWNGHLRQSIGAPDLKVSSPARSRPGHLAGRTYKGSGHCADSLGVPGPGASP